MNALFLGKLDSSPKLLWPQWLTAVMVCVLSWVLATGLWLQGFSWLWVALSWFAPAAVWMALRLGSEIRNERRLRRECRF